MSPPSRSESESANLHRTGIIHRFDYVSTHVGGVEHWSNRVLHLLRALGFWAAIVLPFLHIPLLLSGLTTEAEVIAFALLVTANIIAIRLGMDHRRA